MSNEWHFASFEFELLLFQLDEFCSAMVYPIMTEIYLALVNCVRLAYAVISPRL